MRPGSFQFPAEDAPTTVFVADDVDKAWDELGPYLLHDAVTAASYRHGDDSVASISRADSVERAARSRTARTAIFTTDEAAAYMRSGRAAAARCRSAAGCHPSWRGPTSSAPPMPRPGALTERSRSMAVHPIRVVVWSTGGVGSIAVDADHRRDRIWSSWASGCIPATRSARTRASSQAETRSAWWRPTTPTR